MTVLDSLSRYNNRFGKRNIPAHSWIAIPICPWIGLQKKQVLTCCNPELKKIKIKKGILLRLTKRQVIITLIIHFGINI